MNCILEILAFTMFLFGGFSFSTYCLKNSVKDCLKDCLWKGQHTLSLLLTLGQLRVLNLSPLTLWSSSDRQDIVAVAALNAYWLNQYYLGFCGNTKLYVLSLRHYFGSWLFSFTHIYITLILWSHTLDKHVSDLHIKHVITSELLSFMIISDAKKFNWNYRDDVG